MTMPESQLTGSLQEYAAVLARQLLSTKHLDVIFQSGVFLQSEFDQTTETLICDELAECLALAGAKVARLQAARLTDGEGLVTLSAEISAQVSGKVWNKPPRSLRETVCQATSGGDTLVLILREIETLGCTQEGVRVLRALKACRDAVNLVPDGQGRFLLVGVGKPRAIAALTGDSMQAFYGAALLAMRVS